MLEKLQIYKCLKCGNIVEVIHGGGGSLTCCSDKMSLMEEQSADPATQKHVPIIEKSDAGYVVKVGSTPHPMEEEHYIEWIALTAEGKEYRQFLKPGMPPEAIFKVDADNVSAQEFCNIHNLWKG